jgi:hypothetical protein
MAAGPDITDPKRYAGRLANDYRPMGFSESGA